MIDSSIIITKRRTKYDPLCQKMAAIWRISCLCIYRIELDSNDEKNARCSRRRLLSQLVRYARICTSKVDFIHRLHQLSSRLQRQGFKYALLLKSLTRFFNCHGATIGKYGTTLRELKTAITELKKPPYPLLYVINYYYYYYYYYQQLPPYT